MNSSPSQTLALSRSDEARGTLYEAAWSLWVQAYASYKGLFGWLNWPGYLSTFLFRPVLAVVMFALLGRFARDAATAENYAIGMTLYSLIVGISGGIMQTYAYERGGGTLPAIQATPMNQLIHYLVRPLLHMPNGILIMIVSLVTLRVFVGLQVDDANLPGILLASLATILSVSALTMFIGPLVLVQADWTVVWSIILSTILVISGMIVPVESLPEVAQLVAEVMPGSHGLSALRASIAGEPFEDFAESLGHELGIGLVYLSAGFFVSRWTDGYLRRTGRAEVEASTQ